MPTLEDVKIFNHHIANIQNLLHHLNGLEFASVPILNDRLEKIKRLGELYKGLAKSSHNGEFSPAMRKKLDKLKVWKDSYNTLLEQEARMRKNKKSVLDQEEVSLY